jgi:hypothetical protein
MELTPEARKARSLYHKRWSKSPEVKERLNRYRKEWRLKNPEKEQQYQITYWTKWAKRNAGEV